MADSFFSAICSCALKQLGAEGFDLVRLWLGDHLSDQGHRLTSALKESNEKAWRAVEIALAGETLWNKFDRADDRGFRTQLAAFLKQAPMPELEGKQTFRKKILQDIHDAKKKAILYGRLVPEELAERVGPMANRSDPQAVLAAERKALRDMAAEVKKARLDALAWLLEQPAQPGQSVVIVSIRYYFRRAVEEDAELARGLQFTAMENLTDAQKKGFDDLEGALKAHAGRVDQAMADLIEIAAELRDAAGEVRDATLDLRSEMEKMRGENKELYAKVLQMLEQQQMHQRPVHAGDSLTIHSDHERHKVKEFLARYRQMPEEQKRAAPALLNGLGKLQVATGDYANAQEAFTRVAEISPDGGARAEGHFNAYRAALEQAAVGDGSYQVALAELKMAMRFDAARFAPFPPEEYEAQRILGAGGFGVTFLCKKRLTGTDVAVKSLQADGLERDVSSVMQEASTLDQLAHPAIIRLRHCGYADPRARSRPFIEMDYFESNTLEDYVRKNGPLSVGNVLALSKTVAEALLAAHGKGILHRDVKPANLLVRRPEGRWEVRVIDFGLALKQDLLGQSAGSSRRNRSMTGADIAGTRHYAAPEQMGELIGVRVGPWSDVYGWAKTCCYALFQNAEPTYLEYKKVPEALGILLGQCLSRLPNDRPSNFAEVLEKLAKVRPDAPKPPQPQPQPQPKPQPKPQQQQPKPPPPPPKPPPPPFARPAEVRPKAPDVRPITELTGGNRPFPSAIPVPSPRRPAEVVPTGRSSPRLPPPPLVPRSTYNAALLPGLAIILTVVASIAINLFCIYMTLLDLDRGRGDEEVNVTMLVVCGAFVLASGLAGLSGVAMCARKLYVLALVGCVLVMLPIGWCCVGGLPVGLWGLMTLMRPDVRSTFT